MSQHAPSYYAATAHRQDARPPLAGTERADVCIIGAGFTGISAALELAERGFSVIVLEDQRTGFGASGRNGGQMVNGYSRGLDVITKRYGEAAGRQIGAMAMQGGQIIRERAAKYNIACDLRPGNMFTAITAKQMRGLEHHVKIWNQHGYTDFELLDRPGLAPHVQRTATPAASSTIKAATCTRSTWSRAKPPPPRPSAPAFSRTRASPR